MDSLDEKIKMKSEIFGDDKLNPQDIGKNFKDYQ